MADQTNGGRVAVINNDGGLRFLAELGGNVVATDQPERGGGTGTAVTPLDLMPISLGSCIALYAHQFCVARNIPDEDLRVEVRWESASAPKRIGRFEVKVLLPDALPGEYRAAIERAVLTCPVHNTLTHAPEIAVQLVEPAGV
jgi:putative redox protein